MNEPKLIFLEPVPDEHFGDRDWCQDDVWEGSVRYVLESDARAIEAALRDELGAVKGEYDRAINKVDALQQRLTAADERVDVLEGLLANAFESAAKWIEKRMDDYVNEHGNEDPETGSLELPGTGDEYVGELMEIADGLRALKPIDVESSACSSCNGTGHSYDSQGLPLSGTCEYCQGTGTTDLMR